MNFFCRILGHTWVHETEAQKIRWTTNAKTLAELVPTPDGEAPAFYRVCARCGERRAWEAPAGARGGSEAPSEGAGA